MATPPTEAAITMMTVMPMLLPLVVETASERDELEVGEEPEAVRVSVTCEPDMTVV